MAPDLAPAPIPLLRGVIATPPAAPAILGVRVAAAAAILLAFSRSILHVSTWLITVQDVHTVLSAWPSRILARSVLRSLDLLWPALERRNFVPGSRSRLIPVRL